MTANAGRRKKNTHYKQKFATRGIQVGIDFKPFFMKKNIKLQFDKENTFNFREEEKIFQFFLLVKKALQNNLIFKMIKSFHPRKRRYSIFLCFPKLKLL